MENKTIISGSIKLRSLTLKSLIKFGKDPELTVQEFINLNRERELINFYYQLNMINFNQEVKDLLFITKEREISKPGKNKNSEFAYKCFGDILKSRVFVNDKDKFCSIADASRTYADNFRSRNKREKDNGRLKSLALKNQGH